MRIIIIGASGLIGFHLYSLVRNKGREVIGTYNRVKKNGLIHYDMLSEPLQSLVPDLGHGDVVYLLAAYNNPSWIFENQAISRELNVFATKRIIDEAFNAGARLIFMSSVEVFDGKHGNYNEHSFPNPLNLYGKMKFEIEKYLSEIKGDSCIVRSSWNVGWELRHRCVINLTYETLLSPGAKMAKDNTFSIADVRDTAEGLLRIAGHNELRICHLASSPYIVRTQLASLVKSLSRFRDSMNYKVTNFSNIPYSEPRAKHNSLDVSLASSVLGMKFRPPEEIIREKVELLDRHMDEIQSSK